MTRKTNTKRPIRFGKSHKHLSLLDLLKEHSGERASKLEAYLELVDLASVQYIPKDMDKANFHLQSNQFVTTITELADCWHWHRATVRSFIEQLEATGQISVTRLSHCQIVTIPMVHDECAIVKNGSSSSSFIQKIDEGLTEWTNGEMSAANCGSLCEQLYADATSKTATKEFIGMGDDVSGTDRVNVELCRAALRRICMASYKRMLRDNADDSKLMDFFNIDLGGDWQSFIEATKVLTELIVDGESPSLQKDNAAVRSQFRSLCKPFLAVITGFAAQSTDSGADCT